MKKLLLSLLLISSAALAQDVPPVVDPTPAPVVDPTPAPPAAPTINISSVTNVVTIVDPIILTADQMAGIIAMIQSSGISANVPITTNNLNRVNVMKNVDGTFTVRISVN
jgi:hypothetical protein